MAKPRTCRNSALVSKDEFAKKDLIKNNSTFTSIPAVFYTFTLISAKTLALIPGLPDLYMDMNLQRIIKLALKLFFKGEKHG